jgi:hypothetical protein
MGEPADRCTDGSIRVNESTQILLKIIVERAVRSVHASTARKRKMRAELLAHVGGVFAEEFAQFGKEQAALERTALRFGNSREVTKELQASVPASDRIERFWEGRPGESTLRNGLRLAWVFELFVLAVCGITMTAAAWESPWSLTELSAVLSRLEWIPQMSFGPLWLVGIAVFTYCFEKSLRNPVGPPEGWPWINLKQSFVAAWAVPSVRHSIIGGCACFAALMGIRAANWSTAFVDLDRSIQIGMGLLFAGDLAATSVICAWVFVQTADARRRYHAEWANLKID